jgi:hypothetical protein
MQQKRVSQNRKKRNRGMGRVRVEKEYQRAQGCVIEIVN